jgi:hypothetical protein
MCDRFTFCRIGLHFAESISEYAQISESDVQIAECKHLINKVNRRTFEPLLKF